MDTHFEQHLPRSPARPELSLPGEDEQISTLHAEPEHQPGTLDAGSHAGAGEAKTAKDAAPQTAPEPSADQAEPAAESSNKRRRQISTLPAEPQEEPGTPDASGDAGAGKAKTAQDVAPQTTPAPSADQAGPAAKSRNKRRSLLMTSAAVGVTLIAAAGVFLISPYNHIIPLDLSGLQGARPVQPGATQHIALPAPIAPSANLARAPAPQATPAPNRPTATAQPRADDVQEILGFRPGGPRRDAPATDKPAGDRSATTQPAPPPPVASAEEATAQPITAVPPATTPLPNLQPVSTAVPATPTVTPPGSRDPVKVAATLQAAPMSTTQQVDVLNVVTELGTLLRNQRAENAQLREDVQQMRERLDTQLNDYARRLALAEARGAVSAAMGAGASTASSPTAVLPASITVMAPMPPPAGAVPRGARTAAAMPSTSPAPTATQDAPRRYRVQAASPGLAMLAEVDRTGDAGNLLQVSIGDDVPGYGKVKSIAQQGAAWVLTAERGTIR